MQASTYERRALLTLPAIERFPRPHGVWVSLLRSGIQLTMRGLLRTVNRLEIAGQENLPLNDSFIMVCNHSSHLDAVCLLASLPLTRVHRAFPVAAADYFFATPLRSMLSVIAVNGLPIDRHHGGDGLERCRELLNVRGHVVIIFPEGTRTCSGAIGRFRSGVARLAAGTRTPVVPCHLSGAFEAWPKGRAVPRAFPVRLRIGCPRTFADVSAADHAAILRISSQLRDDVIELGERSTRKRSD
jgi:1-acyl-sn-glycerol-3-phosphate acyltransferase